MADFYTQFSCLLDVGSNANAARAIDLYAHTPPDEQGACFGDGFDVAIHRADGSELWIYADHVGDVEQVIRFVLLCAAEFDLQGLWGFDYANTCSRPRLEAFGGGAHAVDLGRRQSIGWVSTSDWLAAALSGGDPDA